MKDHFPCKSNDAQWWERAKLCGTKIEGLLILLGFLFGATTRGAEGTFTEYQVKALFLFNFVKYVEWPADAFVDANGPIRIGLVGESNIGEELKKAVEGKSVSGRKIEVRQMVNGDEWGKCHVLFIAASEKSHAADILKRVKRLPVLTVGETEQFTGQGGIINFTKKEGNIRVEINLNSARQAKVQISSRLLGVADVVIGKIN